MLALPHLWSLHGYSMLVAVLWYVRKLPLFSGEREFRAGAPATPRLGRA